MSNPPASAAGAPSSVVSDDPTANRVLDRAKEIRAMVPKWDTFGHVVDGTALAAVATFAADATERKRSVESGNAEPLLALLTLFDKLSFPASVQFIITLLDDVVEEHPRCLSLMMEACAKQNFSVVELFVKKLTRSDDVYICHQSARMAARLFAAGAEADQALLREYYQWLLGEMDQEDRTRTLLALTSMAVAFRRTQPRAVFVKMGDGLGALQRLVKVDAPIQQQYQAVLCLWILTFSTDIVEAIADKELGLVAAVADILNAAKKEKVVRVCLAFLRNMAEKSKAQPAKSLEVCVLMVGHGLLSIVQSIATLGTYSDEELKADAEALAEMLRDTYDHMSTFDEYATELRSGKLEWSPVHRSERFWRENAGRLNDKNHELLKVLVTYLSKSDDLTTLAVAVHDLGEYMTHYPYGRKALGELGGKTLIMDLMNHEDSTVRYEALLAVQKMMTDNWEYLGKKVEQEAKKATA